MAMIGGFLLAIIKLLVILCIVATIHEFGHFLAAKLFKIGVNEFSIGFGPKIFQKKKNDTLYSLRWVPLGGYVMIEGEGEQSDKENSFSKQHPFKRIIVLVMGVVFNLILGFLVLTSISFFIPVYTTEITEIAETSPLKDSGILVGDKITKINGEKVVFANELIITNYDGPSDVVLEYVRNDEKKYAVVSGAKVNIGYIGVAFKTIDGNPSNEVNYTQAGSVAEQANIKSDDIITAINGTEVKSATEIISIIQKNAGKNVELTVLRNGNEQNISIVPDSQSRLDFGILNTKEEKSNIYYALTKAVKAIGEVIGSYAELFKGNVGINDVSSIVGIGVVVSQTSGIIEYLNMLAIISLAVGAANILPFVPLDGGKIIFVVYEWITKKKVSEKVEVITSYIGWGLLMLLTIVVMFKDVINIF